MTMKYRVAWQHDRACGVLAWDFDTRAEADAYARKWCTRIRPGSRAEVLEMSTQPLDGDDQ